MGELWYSLGIKDTTENDIKAINARLRKLGSEITLTPKIIREMAQSAVPKGIKIELDPVIRSEALERAAQNHVMRVAVTPLITGFREAIARATRENPPLVELGIRDTQLRTLIEQVLLRQGFMINVNTVNGDFVRKIQETINGHRYNVTIRADVTQLTTSIQTALRNVNTRHFGLEVSKDMLQRSIETALTGKKFYIQIAVMHDQARQAVRNALMQAQVIGKDQALAYQRLMTGELRAAQTELAKLKMEHRNAADAATTHASASIRLGNSMGSNIRIAGELGAAMASLYSVHAAKEFLSQVIEIGGELEHQKIAMNTIFGDKGKTNELYGQIKGLARNSPFGVMELTKSVKALTAYGVEYNEIYDTAKRLADISAATSVDINRLILAFGKTKSRGFLDGLEAKQFAYANIPIYEMIRKKLEEVEGQAVTTADVMKRMKKREIGFDMVKDVLWDITDEGGKFYNMQNALAGSVKTSWKLVKDNIDLMFGEIAEGRIGGSLKWIAEILQVMTRNWKTLGAVIGSAAISYGIYKVAVMSSNAAMGTSIAGIVRENSLRTAQTNANIKAALSYRSLTQAEIQQAQAAAAMHKITGLRILSSQKLTLAELRHLVAEKNLSKQQILNLVALKKVDAQTAERILLTKGMTGAEEALMLTEIHRANNAKKHIVLWRTLKATMAGALATLRSFALASLPMLAIGALVSLWQRNKEEMEKAKEIGDNVFTKASEGAKSLGQILKEIKSPEGLDNHQLTQGIEQMEQAIKDYSPTPIEDINNALVAQDGHVRTLAERYEYLRSKVESLNKSYEEMADVQIGRMVEGSLKATDEGWFNDGLVKNAKDYTEALKRVEDRFSGFASKYARELRSVINAAMKADEAFRNAASGLSTYEERFKLLTENSDKYQKAAETFNALGLNGKNLNYFSNNSQIENARKELISDTDKFIENMNARLIKKGANPFMLTDSQKQELAVSLKNVLSQMEGVGEEARAIIARKWEETWHLTGMIMEDKIGPSLQGNFKKLAAQSTDEAVRAAIRKLQYEGYAGLSDAEKKVVTDLMEKAKKQTMADLGVINDTMQDYLKSHPLEQIITLTVVTDDNAPSELAKELVRKKGFAGLTDSVNKYVNQWTKSNAVYESRNAAQQALQEAVNELDAAKKAGAGLEAAKKKYDEVQAALQYLEWTDLATKDQKSNKHPKGSQKDPLAESLRQRFKDIKDAWSEMQKWTKTEGRDKAMDRVAESGLFSTLSKDDIPRTIEEYRELVENIRSELERAGVKGTARENLLNDLLKQLLEIDGTQVKETLDIALDKVNKEIERELANWKLYEKIRRSTGNESLAVQIAFGLDGNHETDYVRMVKKQFDQTAKALDYQLTYETATAENMQSAPEALRKAWEKANSDILKYLDQQREAAVSMLTEYQSLEDQIDAVNAKRRLALENINARDASGKYILSEAERAKRSSLANTQADYDIFTKSNDYLKFFNDIYGLTMSEANRIGDLIQLNLNTKLQAGLITIFEYEKEMEKVRKQLEAMRNIKSDALTFLTGGLKGLNEKRLRKAEGALMNNSGYQKALENQIKAQEELNRARESGDAEAIAAAQTNLDAANESLKVFTRVRDTLVKNIESLSDTLAIVNMVANIAQGVSDAFNTLRNMATALGANTDSDAWDTAQTVMDTLTTVTGGVQKVLQSLLNGDIGGIISGTFDTLLSPITMWAELHDKKLDRVIEKSKQAAQLLQAQYDIIEKRMTNFLGNAAMMNTGTIGGGYGRQRELMTAQAAELQKQLDAERAKKNKDKEALSEYENQLEELKIEIRDFAIEVAQSLYDIDLNGWAEQLGDALVDAFAKGEDAADAFRDTVGDIMRSVVSKMISADLLAPMFADLEQYLFGSDGMSGAFGKDFRLDPDELAGMKAYLDKIQNEGIPAAQELFDAIEAATGGLLTDIETAREGLSAGIQSVTEDTAALIASYINAIRASVAMNETRWERLLGESMPQMSAIAQSQLDCQRQIAENTLRSAAATEALLKTNDEINRLLVRVTNGAARFYVN